MSSASEGKAAIAALEGKNLDGRNLTVNEARPKEEGAKRSFHQVTLVGIRPDLNLASFCKGDLPICLFLRQEWKCASPSPPGDGDVDSENP